MKLLLENWRKYLIEGVSRSERVKKKIMDFLKQPYKLEGYSHPWGMYETLVEVAGAWAMQSLDIPGVYLKQFRQAQEKLKKFLSNREVEVTKFDHEGLDYLVGTKGTISDIRFHPRNRPVLTIEWVYQGDEESTDTLYGAGTGRLRAGPLPTSIKAGDYYIHDPSGGLYLAIDLVSPITIEDVERTLDETLT